MGEEDLSVKVNRTWMKFLWPVIGVAWISVAIGQPYYVAPTGDDGAPGTLERPFASVHRAQRAARAQPGTIFLRGGTHYLSAPLVFGVEDSGTEAEPVVYQAYPGETPVLSGGKLLEGLHWVPCGGGVYQAEVTSGWETEELFVNGVRQTLARYPNFDASSQYFDGFAEDAISPARVARWADPEGGFFHAMHPALWGDFTWRILGKDAAGGVMLEGGWQNNRGGAVHEKIRFVENIREELDAPGEWFLDRRGRRLFYFPPAGLELSAAKVEVTLLRSLVEFRGTEQCPVRHVVLRGVVFRHAARTVMETKEPLLRTDWAIYRGGAVFLEGTEDCGLEDSALEELGGNAVFVNQYNRRVAIRGCHVVGAGASGICFVGDPKAARSPLFHYGQVNRLEELDMVPGPRTENYPADCCVEDCLIERSGRVEKQTAGVNIDLARRITVRHCSIYDMPRAGINIGDGCWGGHVIEHCDVFDTVKETGDHGSFNSWGRDRFWRPNTAEVNAWVRQHPELPRLDAVEPVVLRNNRWRCDHGWDIDLDDGSSYYVISNNLCLRGGIKNREGYGRVVVNNVLVGAGFHPHVWYESSRDVFRCNVVWQEYQPALMPSPPWGADLDYNLLHREAAQVRPATELQQQSGRDIHSLVGDALWVDPSAGDFRVRADSPALALGFQNFNMDEFGVRSARLRAMARTPVLPEVAGAQRRSSKDGVVRSWLEGRVRDVADEGEMSALGLAEVSGVLLVEVTEGTVLARGGLRAGDVVVSVNGVKAEGAEGLVRQVPALADFQSLEVGVWRQQTNLYLRITR